MSESDSRQNAAMHRTLLENIPQKIFFKDRGLSYLACNAHYARDLGISPEDITGKTDFDFFSNDLAEKYRADDQRIMAAGVTEELTEAYVTNGKEHFVNTIKTPVRDESGSVTGILGVFWDVTEKTLSERELRVRSKITGMFLTADDDTMYSQVLEVILEALSSECGVFGYIREDGALVAPSLTAANRRACKAFGDGHIFMPETWGKGLWPRAIRQKTILCKNVPSPTAAQDLEPNMRHAAVPILYGGEVIGMFQVADKKSDYNENDLRMCQAIADAVAPVLNARLQRDRQEARRRQAEAQLKKTLDDLKRSNRELEQFAYVASHDLQEPLRMVASYVQLLERRYKDKLDSDANEFIAYAVDGASRMKTLINDLLAFSRVETRGGPLEKTDSMEALGEALANLQHIVEDTGAVVLNDELPVIWADYTQIVQLFQNLIGNALKFRGDSPPLVRVSARQQDGAWEFCVQDNGIGIAPEFFERIFIIFQRLHGKTTYPGTGIGLAICKRIVERHRGRIWVESEPGKGAAFRFTIPHKKGE